MKKKNQRFSIKNKRATFDYTILQKYTAGIILQGTEVKSIKAHKVSLQEAYCFFQKGELWLKNMHVAIYEQGGLDNHEEKRTRKLLLSQKELHKLAKSKEKGLTIIPLEISLNLRGFIKVSIGLAKGKKKYDKRQSLKEKDLKRELARTSRLI